MDAREPSGMITLGSDEAYRALFNRMLNGLAYCRVIYDGTAATDFVYLAVNAAFEAQTGLTGVAGRYASEVIPGIQETDRELIQRYGRVARSGHPERFEHYVEALQMWFSVSVYSPAPDHFVAIFDVITEQKLADAALRDSERRLARVIEGSDQGFWDWNLVTNVFSVSARFETMLGYQPGEMDVSIPSWKNIVHPDDLALARESIDRHLSGQTPTHEVELRCRTKTGEWLWLLTRGRVVERDADGSPLMMSGTHTDISARKRDEFALRQAAIVFDNTQEGVVITDAEARILSVNRAFTTITGFDEHEVVGQHPKLLKSGRHDTAFYALLWDCLMKNGHWQGELWNRRKNGEIYPQLTTIDTVVDAKGEVTHYVSVFTDISSSKETETRLEFLAHHDPLTGLPNRLLFFSRLDHAMKVACRENTAMALLMIDLDRFKDINDSYGHLAGDALLQQVAYRLKARLRGADTLARLGGDEFTVLLENLPRHGDVGKIADEILATLAAPCLLPDGTEVRVAASIGIALHPGQADSAEALFQRADAAMYRAKYAGRGRYHFFTEELTQAARQRVEMESNLRQAIRDGELRVFLQPQMDIASGRIIGAEALVRWESRDGLIMPDRFIPLAEETGLIVPLGLWVLRESCCIGCSWPGFHRSPLKLAVNVSSIQLCEGNFARDVLQVLADSGFPADCLELELTESALMVGHDKEISQLHVLRKHGIRISIDDFGTGYSSLAYLKRLPLDVLKIDRIFIENVASNQDDREIVTAIIQIAHTLGFAVIAEGVETEAQLECIAERGCDGYQGYLSGRPLPSAQFELLLRQQLKAG